MTHEVMMWVLQGEAGRKFGAYVDGIIKDK
jgi:hypothetical protein